MYCLSSISIPYCCVAYSVFGDYDLMCCGVSYLVWFVVLFVCYAVVYAVICSFSILLCVPLYVFVIFCSFAVLVYYVVYSGLIMYDLCDIDVW